MRSFKVVIATLILFGGIWVNLNPDLVNTTYNFDDSDENPHLVGLQENEHWLVIRVAFPSMPHSLSETESLLLGPDSAQEYISQLSGGVSNLEVTISDEVWISDFEESYWGADSQNERDVGNGGSGVDKLVEESALDLLSGMDLSQWDINGDGVIDRLLVLHSGNAQESGGPSNSIWSHFSNLMNPVSVGQWEIQHYTISSMESGLGTLIHEMLHQMGAYDLYDVHSDLPSSTWNGLGDWDIMASGNWNGNSMSPAMPGAATLITVGGLGMIEIETSSTQDIQLYPMSSKNNNTRVAYIETAPDEAVLVTYRADIGFDSELPGSGIIVEYLDKNNGNVDENTVNKDPNNPWVKILEADGDQALVRNRDSGSPGDAFQSGDSFGHEGFKIRDNRGRLVPWQIEVQSIETDVATLRFSTLENYTDRVLTPRSPIQLIEGENAYASVFSENPCTLLVNISTDLTVPQATEVEIPSGETIIPIIRASETSDDLGLITGKIGCKDKNLEDIRIEWQKIGHRIVTKETFHVIPWNQDSTIQIPINTNGYGERSYDIAIEGAVDRIASSSTQGVFTPGDEILLKIEPNGLLTPGMYARGEIVIQDEFSVEQRIEITLIAESPFTGDGLLGWISQPSNGILVISILLAFSILTGKSRDIT